MAGGLGVVPQNILKEVDEICRILVHLTMFLDSKLSPSFFVFTWNRHGLQLLTTIMSWCNTQD